MFGWLALALAVVVRRACRGDLGGSGRRVLFTLLLWATPHRLVTASRGVERSRRESASRGGTRG